MEKLLNITNLTPHSIKLLDPQYEDGSEIICEYPSKGVARVSEKLTDMPGAVDGFIKEVSYGETTGLPEPVESDYFRHLFIVSNLVRMANPHRKDLISPAGFIRDKDGNVIGCTYFIK